MDGSLTFAPFDLVFTVWGDAAEKCPTILGKSGNIHAGFCYLRQMTLRAITEEAAVGHCRRVRDEIRMVVEHALVKRLPLRNLISLRWSSFHSIDRMV